MQIFEPRIDHRLDLVTPALFDDIKNLKQKKRFVTHRSSKDIENCCDSPLLSEEDGFFVCKNCGIVSDRIIDMNPRRAFNQEEINRRKINEPVYSPIGPRTVIRGTTDANGSQLQVKDRLKFHRLSKIHRSLTSSFERNLWIALPNFQRMQERLGLSMAVTEDALRIYTRGVKEKLTLGRSIDILLAASIFTSLKIHSVPLSVDEVLKIADVPRKSVIKCYRLIILQILPQLKIKVTRLEPVRYVDKLGEEMQLPMHVRKLAGDLIRKAKSHGLLMEGKDPKGFAGAALYLSAKKHNLPKTQIEIALNAHITEVTLRMRARELDRFF